MQILIKRVAIGANFICTLLGAAARFQNHRPCRILALCARLFAPCVNFACKKSAAGAPGEREKKNKWQAAAIEARRISAVGYWKRRERGAQKPPRNYSTHHYEDVRNITHCQRNLRDFEHRQRRQNAIIVRSPERPTWWNALLSRVNVDVPLANINLFSCFFCVQKFAQL